MRHLGQGGQLPDTAGIVGDFTCYHRKTIPSDYLDIMGHMNIRWYFDLFAKSGRKFFTSHGLDEDYFRGGNFGVFTLKQFIQYLAEVRVGQTVADSYPSHRSVGKTISFHEFYDK